MSGKARRPRTARQAEPAGAAQKAPEQESSGWLPAWLGGGNETESLSHLEAAEQEVGSGQGQATPGNPDLFLELFTAFAKGDELDPGETAMKWAQLSPDEHKLILKNSQSGDNARAVLGIPDASQQQEPGLLQQGLGLAADTAVDLAVAGNQALDGLTSWFSGDESSESAVATAEAPAVQQPEVVPEGPAETPGSSRDVYKNQLDNETRDGDVKGSNMCNVTTLAMQVVTVAGGGEQGEQHAKRVMADILAARGGGKLTDEQLEAAQLEDLIYQRFSAWSQDQWRAEFDNVYKGFYNDGVGASGKVHQNHYGLTVVLQEFVEFGIRDGASSEFINGRKFSNGVRQSAEHLQSYIKPILDAGGSVSMGTKLSAAHVVLLADVLPDGILIQDPYGLKLKNPGKSGDYIRNDDSQASAQRKLDQYDPSREILDRRTSHNAGARAALDADHEGPLPADLGRLNFYTFDEVKRFSMTWRTIIQSGQ